MLERERKYRLSVADAARLAALLERSGSLVRSEVQDNARYVERTGGRPALDLRLRTVPGRQELTLKGPRLEGGPSKTREELNVTVTGDVEPLLEALGFARTVSYQKRTSIYAFGGAAVSLDEVDGLGLFCEVEATDDDVIEAVARTLGLDPSALEQRGYARLVKDAAKI